VKGDGAGAPQAGLAGCIRRAVHSPAYFKGAGTRHGCQHSPVAAYRVVRATGRTGCREASVESHRRAVRSKELADRVWTKTGAGQPKRRWRADGHRGRQPPVAICCKWLIHNNLTTHAMGVAASGMSAWTCGGLGPDREPVATARFSTGDLRGRHEGGTGRAAAGATRGNDASAGYVGYMAPGRDEIRQRIGSSFAGGLIRKLALLEWEQGSGFRNTSRKAGKRCELRHLD